MSSVLLHGCGTRSLLAEDIRCLEVFHCQWLRGITRIGWGDWVSNAKNRSKVLGTGSEDTTSPHIEFSRLLSLVHVWRMAITRLPYHVHGVEESRWRTTDNVEAQKEEMWNELG